jgi:hypothetical protein
MFLGPRVLHEPAQTRRSVYRKLQMENRLEKRKWNANGATASIQTLTRIQPDTSSGMHRGFPRYQENAAGWIQLKILFLILWGTV